MRVNWDLHSLLDMAGAADEAPATGGVSAADLDHDAARGRRSDQFMRVMARGALNPMLREQCLVDRLPSQTRSVPGRRYGRCIDRQQRLGVADVVGGRVFQLTVRRSQRGVIHK